jgi:hypothetical protein
VPLASSFEEVLFPPFLYVLPDDKDETRGLTEEEVEFELGALADGL